MLLFSLVYGVITKILDKIHLILAKLLHFFSIWKNACIQQLCSKYLFIKIYHQYLEYKNKIVTTKY